MDRSEARVVAEQVVHSLRSERYEALTPLLDQSRWSTHTGPSGTEYEVQVFALWDDVVDGHLRVVAAAGRPPRWRLGWIRPESADFIIGPDGRFVGE